MLRWWCVLVVVAGCRVPSSRWGGTPPTLGSERVTIALRTDSEETAKLVRATLSSRGREVAFVPFEPTTCDLDCACAWSKEHGADYYVSAWQHTEHEVESKCTKWTSPSIFDHAEPECLESTILREGGRSQVGLEVRDVLTCKPVPALSTKVVEQADGPEGEGEIIAAGHAAERLAKAWPGFPSQTTIGPDRRVADADDGQYALFRYGQFTTLVAVKRGAVENLMCCTVPSPGDQLVRRGDVKYIELLLSFESALVQSGGTQQLAAGAGLHFRRYAIAGGLQYGLTGTALAGNDAPIAQLAAEVGWGIRPHGAWHLSANLAAGATHFIANIGAGMEKPTAWEPHVAPNVRALFRLETWWYLGADVGYALSATTSWTGKNRALADDARLRGPFARVYAAIDL